MPETRSESPRTTSSAGEAFAQLGDDLSAALRQELERFRGEMADRASAAAKGTGLLAGAGVAGTIAATAAATLPIMALRRILPGWMLALLMAGGAGGAAVVLAQHGLDELSAAAPAETERVKEAARDAVRSVT